MIEQKSIDFLKSKYESLGLTTNAVPKAHIVLGSGFGQALEHLPGSTWEVAGEIGFAEIPGVIASTVADHAGRYRLLRHKSSGHMIQFQMGRLHGYEGHSPRAVVGPVMIPRLCGVENFILTNAAGGLLPEMNAGDVMLLNDHVNMTGTNPLIGENPKTPAGVEIGPRFPDMGNTYQPAWRKELKTLITGQGLKVHDGVYMGLMGPTFETHAEVRLFQQWGMGAVGMSTVWEAIALKHSGARLAGISLISNQGAGLGAEQLDHHVILETCRKSASQILTGLCTFLEREFLK